MRLNLMTHCTVSHSTFQRSCSERKSAVLVFRNRITVFSLPTAHFSHLRSVLSKLNRVKAFVI